MDQITDLPLGFQLYGFTCACPTSADDMVLMSLSKHGYDRLMNICYNYGMHNKYLYNTGKSAVMNEIPNEYRSTTRSWSLGDDTVSELNTYKHLGITLSKYCNRFINVEECCQKLRSTFLTLVHCGLF